ncbi:hypothetical protein CK203_108968 [Vitis vinifera]|uniref:Uncharacterized protein n=1 Tax=Vitis vinifera TaxID=29760 RepID=A0A438BQ36_VITVI|nr:hypothetical protein CK203_108968 [Vitis vinifera]
MKQFSCHSTPRGHQFEEATSASRPISAIARIRGGHTDPLVSREARPSSSAPRDSSQAFQAPTVPSSEGDMPSNPPQPKTSSPGKTSRYAQPDSQALTDSQRPFDIAPEAIIKRPMAIAPPTEGNSDCRAKSFHSELYFDIEAMQQQPELRIHLDYSRGTISSTL